MGSTKKTPKQKHAASLVEPAAATTQVHAGDQDDGGKLIRGYIAGLPALAAPQQRAFNAQCPMAKADEYGARTRAINVLHGGERFARIISGALKAPRGRLAYTEERFRFFADLLLALRAAIEVDVAQSRTHGKAQTSVASAHDQAALVREMLVERLGGFAEGNDGHKAALARALGTTKDDDALLRSLASLTDLAATFLDLPDEESRALCASVRLDQAALSEAKEARAELAGAHEGALGEGPRVVRDSPATNRIEGRVLFEMRYAMQLFDGAHARDAVSPRLFPDRGTRAVLGRATSTPPPDGTPTVAAGASGAAAGTTTVATGPVGPASATAAANGAPPRT